MKKLEDVGSFRAWADQLSFISQFDCLFNSFVYSTVNSIISLTYQKQECWIKLRFEGYFFEASLSKVNEYVMHIYNEELADLGWK